MADIPQSRIENVRSRIDNVCRAHGKTREELAALSDFELRSLPNFGQTCFEVLRAQYPRVVDKVTEHVARAIAPEYFHWDRMTHWSRESYIDLARRAIRAFESYEGNVRGGVTKSEGMEEIKRDG